MENLGGGEAKYFFSGPKCPSICENGKKSGVAVLVFGRPRFCRTSGFSKNRGGPSKNVCNIGNVVPNEKTVLGTQHAGYFQGVGSQEYDQKIENCPRAENGETWPKNGEKILENDPNPSSFEPFLGHVSPTSGLGRFAIFWPFFLPLFGFGKRGLLEKGSFQKSPFSRDFLETLVRTVCNRAGPI